MSPFDFDYIQQILACIAPQGHQLKNASLALEAAEKKLMYVLHAADKQREKNGIGGHMDFLSDISRWRVLQKTIYFQSRVWCAIEAPSVLTALTNETKILTRELIACGRALEKLCQESVTGEMTVGSSHLRERIKARWQQIGTLSSGIAELEILAIRKYENEHQENIESEKRSSGDSHSAFLKRLAKTKALLIVIRAQIIQEAELEAKYIKSSKDKVRVSILQMTWANSAVEKIGSLL